MDTAWDVDKYYDPHEPSHHWELRRKFIVQNKDRYPEERLVCLARTFANMEFLGCRYPKQTMDLVEDLAFGVVQEYREQQKNRLKRTFVSGSTAAGDRVNRGQKRKGGSSDAPVPSKKSPSAFFVPASSSSEADQRRQLSTPAAGPQDHDSLSPSNAVPAPEKSSVYERINPPLQRRLDASDPLSSFVLAELEWCDDTEHPCNLLNRSAGLCKMSCQWEYRPHPAGHLCSIKVDCYQVSSATAWSKNEARDAAARKAVDTLRKRCYTVRVKNKYMSDGTVIDSKLTGEGSKSDSKNEIGSGNVGYKLLKMMGWSGGGLGKGGSGISEPITAESFNNRQGLGAGGIVDRNFKKRVRKLIEEYATSANPYDLVFTTGFSNDQRKEMHMIAKRLGLKSKSFGKEEERFLTISRKTSSQELIRDLLDQGGSTDRYDLIAPRVDDSEEPLQEVQALQHWV